MLKKLVILSVCLGTAFAVNSSDEAEFRKWLKQHKKEFRAFVDKHDKEFAEFLKANWVEAEVKPEEKRDSKPKIDVIPETKPEPLVEDDPQPISPLPVPVVKVPEPEPEPEPEPAPDKDDDKKPDETSDGEIVLIPDTPIPVVTPPIVSPSKPDFYYVKGRQAKVEVDMLGRTLTMPKFDAARLELDKVNGDSIADNWLIMAKTKFKVGVEALQTAADDLALDDWGQALLTYEYLSSASSLSHNELQLYSWFYLVKQGFDSRVAFNNGKVFLMLNVKQKLFGQKYFNLKDGKFYFVDLGQKRPISVGSVYTYDQQHADASEALNIDLSLAPNHGEADKSRQLQTKLGNKNIAIETVYNSAYIDFLDHYPQLNMEYYFKASLPDVTRDSLVSQLRPHLQGLSEQQALNLLLHFVQKSLSYQTDQQQFQYENYLFAGETIHYPYADCEDRSVLYAYLVKNLLGNDVIGLQYDGHIATAVAVNHDYAGDKFVVDGKTYLVADPTFINANIGRTMTGLEGQQPSFITF